MTFKKLLLVLCVVSLSGCESREDKYIRLQQELAAKQQEFLLVNETLESLNNLQNYVPKLNRILTGEGFSLVSGSNLVKQIESGAESGNTMKENEIRNSVTKLVDDWTGVTGLSEFELSDLKSSVTSGLTLYQKGLARYHQSQGDETITIEREKLENRADELGKEIEELALLINAMEKT